SNKKAILVPDYEALKGRYQVFKKKDITRSEPFWELKKSELVWRGSTAQLAYRKSLTEENLLFFSRVTLCKLSKQFPLLIDAKFTVFTQGSKEIPSLQDFKGEWISFEEEAQYKYHILIDGNVSSYSCSGWKFF